MSGEIGRFDNYNEDPLGFTRQTKNLLVGLGLEKLVDEAKRRNISDDELCKLTVEDLIYLGLEDDEAKKAQKSLQKLSKRMSEYAHLLNYKWTNLIKILKSERDHLDLIRAYMKHCRKLLSDRRNNNIDCCAIDSKALCLASSSTLNEFKFVQDQLRLLKEEITGKIQKPQNQYYKICTLASALGITGSIMFYILKN